MPTTQSKLRIRSIECEQLPDNDPDLSYLTDDNRYKGVNAADMAKYKQQDKERLEAYNNGYWSCIGIRAVAYIYVDDTAQTITSSGIWGIETDSDQNFLDEMQKEQETELVHILVALGFSEDEIDKHL